VVGFTPEPLKQRPVWEECTTAATEVNPSGQQAGEGKACAGAEGLNRSSSKEYQGPGLNRSQVECRAGGRPDYQRPEIPGNHRQDTVWENWVRVGNVSKDVVLVVLEVSRAKEEQYKIKVLSHRLQEQWTTWEGVINKAIMWADMWKMSQAKSSFLIRFTYETMPSLSNLSLCYGLEESCLLCNTPNPSLQHILSSCKTELAQGQYRWRHDCVLMKLVETLETRRLEVQEVTHQHQSG